MKEAPADCCCLMVIAIQTLSTPFLFSPSSSRPRRVYIITLSALSRPHEHQRWPTDTRLTSHSSGTSDWSHLLKEEAVTGRERISVRKLSSAFPVSPPSVSLSLRLFLRLSLSVSLCLCLPAGWCRAGQVSVIQGCKPEEDWIYL